MFSTGAAPIYIHADNAQGFPFLHISSGLVICCLFCSADFDRCEVIPHCGFDLCFPDV